MEHEWDNEIARLRERVADLELTLDTVREHERGKERERIRQQLEEAQDSGALSCGRDELLDVLDAICPEGE